MPSEGGENEGNNVLHALSLRERVERSRRSGEGSLEYSSLGPSPAASRLPLPEGEGCYAIKHMIPVRYNLRSLVIRRVGTIMTVLGVALTVAVFVSILAMGAGLQSVYMDTGDPLNLILIRQGAQVETNSFFNRNLKLVVEATEGITAVAGEVVVLVNHPRLSGTPANLVVRGISEKSMELRPRVKVVEGRMFRTGLREIVVSRPIAERFKNTKLGERIKMGRDMWNVVGIIDASHTAYDSEIWGDYNEISAVFERYIYNSLLVRCADEASVEAIKDRLKNDRRIQLDVFTQKEYFESQTGTGSAVKVLGYIDRKSTRLNSSH